MMFIVLLSAFSVLFNSKHKYVWHSWIISMLVVLNSFIKNLFITKCRDLSSVVDIGRKVLVRTIISVYTCFLWVYAAAEASEFWWWWWLCVGRRSGSWLHVWMPMPMIVLASHVTVTSTLSAISQNMVFSPASKVCTLVGYTLSLPPPLSPSSAVVLYHISRLTSHFLIPISDMVIWIFCKFGIKRLFPPPNLRFWWVSSHKRHLSPSRPPKGTSLAKTAHFELKRRDRFSGLNREYNKKLSYCCDSRSYCMQ